MESEILAAIIGGAAGLFTSLLTSLLGRRRLLAETEKLRAEAKHLHAQTEALYKSEERDAHRLSVEMAKLRAETDALRNKPHEIERAAYQDLLINFLSPFQDLLNYNGEIYDGLLKGRGALEYHPNTLKRYFDSLPYNDRRKLYWYQRIKKLRANNRSILALIQQYGGRIVTQEFREACVEFRYHADEWKAVWKAVENLHIRHEGEEEVITGEQIPGDEIVEEGEMRGESEYAERFPANLPSALDGELREVKRRAEGDASED